MKIKWPFLIMICLFLPNSAYSEYYRYIDTDGIAHFTHDLNQVPIEYRKTVKIYDELIGEGQTCCDTQSVNQKTTPEYIAEKREKYLQWNEDHKEEVLAFLDKTSQLRKEKAQIIDQGVDLKSPEFKTKMKKYNKKMKTLITQARELQNRAKQYVMEDDTTNKESIKP